MPQKPIRVFVRTALPVVLRIAEIDLNVGSDGKAVVVGGRRVVFLASDDDDAAVEIGALAEKLGFAHIQLGSLSEGGLLVHARGKSWGHLIFKDLIAFDR